MKNYFLFFTLILAGVIAILNNLANVYFWYWEFWWFDIVMHFLGGLWVGMFFLWFYLFSDFFKNTKTNFFVLITISLVSVWVIGVGWEIFEIWVDPLYFQPGYILDTTLDLIMDTLGAIIGSVIYYIFVKQKTNYEQI